MNPGVFALIWQQIAVRVADATGQLTTALQDWVGPKFKLCVLAYFLATLLIAAWSADEAAFSRFFRQLFLAGIVYSLISNGTSFDFYVVGLVDGVVNGISAAIAGIFGGPSQISANIYDTIAVKVFAVGVQTFRNLQWYSPKAWILGLCIVIYWGLSAASIVVIFFVQLASFLATHFLLPFGKLFIACYFFPFIRFLFNGWVCTVLGGVLTQIFTVGWLALFSLSLTSMLATISGGTNNPDDIVTQIFTLFLAAGLVSVFSTMTAFSAFAAVRIAGGAHAQIQSGLRLQQHPPPPAQPAPATSAQPAPAAPAPHQFNRPVGAAI